MIWPRERESPRGTCPRSNAGANPALQPLCHALPGPLGRRLTPWCHSDDALKQDDTAPAAVSHGFRSSFRDRAAEKTDHPREVIDAALAYVVQNKVEAALLRTTPDALPVRRGAPISGFRSGGSRD